MLKLIVTLLFALAFGASHAQQDGELWEMSVSSAEGNQPMGAPMTHKLCLAKEDKASQKMIEPDDTNCKSEYKVSGNKTKYKSVCLMDGDKLTSEGVQEILGPDHYRGEGTVTMEGRSGKQVTRQISSMKKLGSCKVDKFGGMAGPGATEMKKVCGDMVDSMHAPSFLGNDAVCKADKAKFCAKVKQTAESYRDPDKYTIPMDEWDETARACGVDLPAITKAACQRAGEKRRWDFMANHCPAEGKALAAQHCTGRSYTAAMQSEYAQICRTYSADTARDNVRNNAAAPAEAAPASKKKDKSMLDKGKDMLKSLF